MRDKHEQQKRHNCYRSVTSLGAQGRAAIAFIRLINRCRQPFDKQASHDYHRLLSHLPNECHLPTSSGNPSLHHRLLPRRMRTIALRPSSIAGKTAHRQPLLLPASSGPPACHWIGWETKKTPYQQETGLSNEEISALSLHLSGMKIDSDSRFERLQDAQNIRQTHFPHRNDIYPISISPAAPYRNKLSSHGPGNHLTATATKKSKHSPTSSRNKANPSCGSPSAFIGTAPATPLPNHRHKVPQIPSLSQGILNAPSTAHKAHPHIRTLPCGYSQQRTRTATRPFWQIKQAKQSPRCVLSIYSTYLTCT